ncbi:hypothetical protein GCM10011571_02720 [Marinithermofilum abyssi]|uniref:TATA-box binding n=1 Tax=Marinithermofilum abyssi TaxID=1571185 RepID=A0A8J2YCW0_9BACL|nr:YwmB family TATA-box binding protein [Marinithermofilum abyssi]GGE05113.1 hypothetical protein GCM10011571_02720 [Marinithermofilum abyssi]
MFFKSTIHMCLMLCVSSFLVASAPSSQTESSLIHAFDATGARAELYMLHYGSRMNQPQSSDAIPQWVNRMAHEWGLNQPVQVPVVEGKRWSASGTWERNLQVELTVINDEPDQQRVYPYVSVKITGKGHPDVSLLNAKNRLNRELQRFQLNKSTHFSIQGSLSVQKGQYSKKTALLQKVLGGLQAREVEAMKTDRVISVSAYTPRLSGGLQTRGGTMNVQAAAKDGYDNQKIIITLGTPIITIEY